MELPKNIRTWKQLDEALRQNGTRMFYVNIYQRGGSLKMDNGLHITGNLKAALAHLADS